MLIFCPLGHFRHSVRDQARDRPETFLRHWLETAHGNGGCGTAFPRHDLPGFCKIDAALQRERAQGMPGAQRTRSLVCKEISTRVVTTGTPKRSGIPCTMVFSAYTRSPRCAGLDSHRRPQVDLEVILANLIPALGDQDHAISPSALRAARPATRKASIVSRFNVRDDAHAPQRGGTCAQNGRGIFLPKGLDINSGKAKRIDRRPRCSGQGLALGS
jgi:hypothetical protein